MSIDVFNPGGGFDPVDEERYLERYSWLAKGPFVGSDIAVVINGVIEESVRPDQTSLRRTIPRGRVFYMNALGHWQPGVDPAIPSPIAALLVGSDADSFDVNPASYTATPVDSLYGVGVMKQEATLPFYLLDAGAIFQTSEFLPGSYIPGTTVLGVETNDTNFDTAGCVRPGTFRTEHTVGTVTKGPSISPLRRGLNTIEFFGKVVPHN